MLDPQGENPGGVQSRIEWLEKGIATSSEGEDPSNHPPNRLAEECCMTSDAFLLAQATLAGALPEKSHIIHASHTQLRMGTGLDGGFSRESGFLPRQRPRERLPGCFKAWEHVHNNLPVLLRQGVVRQAVDALPPQDADFARLPERFLARAGLVLSALAHSYFFAHREETDLRLPGHVESAWVLITKRLGRPFAGRVVADDILNNVSLDGTPFDLSSSYFDLPEERLSSGLQGRMEYSFAPVLTLMTDAHKHVVACDDEAIAECIEQISGYIVQCAQIFLEITPQVARKGFDPIIWIKSYPAMGNPVREGELGNSGVDAPLFHALDAFLGRAVQKGDLRSMQKDRRQTFPGPIQAFLQSLDSPTVSVRNHVSRSQSKRLNAAFDGILQIYTWFLERHRVKAVGVTGVSLGSGRHTTSSGVKQDGPKKAPPLAPDQMLSRQMKAGIASRMGTRSQQLTARVDGIVNGKRANIVTLAFDAALPLEAGDRVQIWPENTVAQVDQAIVKLARHLGHRMCLDAEKIERLKRCDLQRLDNVLSSVDLCMEAILDAMPSLQPRFYSVGNVTPNQNSLTSSVTLTVGHGKGISSSRLGKLVLGDHIEVSPSPSPRFRLPSDPKAPLILVGQGSGAGPLVGFLRARSRLRVECGQGEMILVVGARRLCDVPYVEDMVELTKILPLTVTLALTQENVVSICTGVSTATPGLSARAPDILQANQQAVEKLIEVGAHVFVCGSSLFGNSIRKVLGKWPKSAALALKREHTPPPPCDWKFYHEDLFGHLGAAPTRTISAAELSPHNKFDDCWTAIDGVVYDLTKFAALHPGGPKVLMESAGTVADRRFFETHGGMHLQEIMGHLGPYAVGVSGTGDLDEERRKVLETTVRVQNALTNNTAFPADRDVPFYAYADALIVFAESGLDKWRHALRAVDNDAIRISQKTLRDGFLELREQSRGKLASSSAKTLGKVEEEVRREYLEHASILHGFLDEVKSALAERRLDLSCM